MHPVEILLIPLGKAFRNRRADETKSISRAPGLTSDNHFALSSPDFRDGHEIPAKFCGSLIGDDISPALTWESLPAGTVDLVLLMEDLDSPGSAPRVHVIAEFPTADGGLAEGALSVESPEIRYLPRGRGPGTYAGPRPLPGHGAHRYRFHLYALDKRADLATLAGHEQLPTALAGHVIGVATLTGTRTS